MLTDLEKRHMLAKAEFCCEYCRRQLQAESYHLDHIWPESKGGLTVMNNMAVCCSRCNQNKGNYTEWIDPFTGLVSPLFHPRRMTWNEHFSRFSSSFGEEIIGINNIGRTTASLLFRSTQQYVAPDLQWEIIEGIVHNPSLYYYLNDLRYRRLQNDFESIHKQLQGPLPEVEATENELNIARYALNFLLIEAYFTRSRVEDIKHGIIVARNFLKNPALTRSKKRDMENFLSILYQQHATILYELGDTDRAKEYQKQATKYFSGHVIDLFKSRPPNDNSENIARILRFTSLSLKYETIDESSRFLNEIVSILRHLNPYYTSGHWSYLIDLVLSFSSLPMRLIERIYMEVTNILLYQGYGTTIDLARLITLRRRWLVLRLIVEKNIQDQMVFSDLKLWQRKLMFNEMRELRSSIFRTRHLIDKKTTCHLDNIFREIMETKNGQS